MYTHFTVVLDLLGEHMPEIIEFVMEWGPELDEAFQIGSHIHYIFNYYFHYYIFN